MSKSFLVLFLVILFLLVATSRPYPSSQFKPNRGESVFRAPRSSMSTARGSLEGPEASSQSK